MRGQGCILGEAGNWLHSGTELTKQEIYILVARGWWACPADQVPPTGFPKHCEWQPRALQVHTGGTVVAVAWVDRRAHGTHRAGLPQHIGMKGSEAERVVSKKLEERASCESWILLLLQLSKTHYKPKKLACDFSVGLKISSASLSPSPMCDRYRLKGFSYPVYTNL